MQKINYLFWVLLVCLISSCGTPQNVSYFQDASNEQSFMIAKELDIRLQKGDKLSIVVHSRDHQLSQMFNLPIEAQRIGSNTTTNQRVSLYSVDNDGNIDFPNIGHLKVEGLNRSQVAELVKKSLVDNDFLKEPVVVVEFENMYINVLGEVAKPGRYTINKDRLTILDAISMAGDLSIQGNRQIVKVLRNEGLGRKTYTMDMTQMASVLHSPAYYLQQDDVVYVDPNDYRKRQTIVNGNNSRSTSTYFSLASLLLSILVLIF